MEANIKYRKWVWAIHLSFWLLLTTLLILVFNEILGGWKQVVTATVVNIFGFLLLVYGHLFYLLPKYFDQKKYTNYAVGLFILLALSSTIRFIIGKGMSTELQLDLDKYFTPSYFGSMFFSGTFFLLISIPLRLIENWIKKFELEKEFKTHQLEAELRFLKAQVNPHFLFNALNNIYSLSFTESKKTPDMILKLSDMMSYMLYDCKSEQVRLDAEIEYLKNYIVLQQLKKDGEFNIDFKIKGNTSSLFVTPMLFIPFFENAFKHGNLDDTKNGWLKSLLKVENGILYFNISNSIRQENTKAPKGGVGLENIRDRLQLLFPDRHKIEIKKNKTTFSVSLEIDMSDVSKGTISTDQ